MSLRKRAAAEAAAAKKGRYFQGLKTGHADQLNKLQTKHQYECDLLDDLRNFSKSRAALEKAFAEGLQKLTTSYLSKKLPPVPELVGSSSDSKSSWNAWSVWISVLEENEAIAKARLAAVEEFQTRIFEDARLVRQAKAAAGKKNLDHLGLIHKELQASAQDLDKAKRTYFEEEHLAYEARTKAQEADERLKRKKGHFFQSLSSLQKNSAKFTAKKESCDERATLARNQYLLQLYASNAHQKRFYNVDLPAVMKALECDVYEKMKDYLTFYTDTELRTCQAMQAAFTEIQKQAKSMTRDYNFACFVTWFPAIAPSITYDFEPCDGDTITRVSGEFGSAEFLDQEATKWSIRLAKELKAIKEYTKKIHNLQSGSKAEKDGAESEAAEPEVKLEELKEFLRIAETAKEKAEARLETLREGGMNIDEYLKKAFTDMETLDPSDMLRSHSQTSLHSDVEPAADSSFYEDDEHQQSYEQQRSMSESEQGDEPTPPAGSQKTMQYPIGDPLAMEWGDEEEEQFPPPPTEANEVVVNGGPAAGPGIKCIAVYAYSAQNADELTIVENEQLEVVGEGDGEGWVLARNYRGEEGFVPKNYVEAEAADEGEQGGGGSSFSSVDYTVDAVKDDNANNLGTTGRGSGSGPMINHVDVAQDDGDYCCAIYDYEATCKEELTFLEGSVIKIMRRQVHEVDDGWWEGEFEGQVGLFPSIVVEDCRPNGEPYEFFDEEEEEEEEEDELELPTPAGPPPPMLSPPELSGFLFPPEGIIITQPTPDVEHPPTAFGEDPPPPPPPQEEEVTTADEQQEKVDPVEEKPQEADTQSKTKETSMPSSYSTIVEGFELKMNEDQRRLYQERQDVDAVAGEEGEEGAETDGSGSSVGPDSVEESEVASVVRYEAHEFAGGLQIASIVVTAATPTAPAPEEDFFSASMPPPPSPPLEEDEGEEEDEREEPAPPVAAVEDEEEHVAKSDESLDDSASVDSVQQKQQQEQPVKIHEDVQIVIDPPNEPAREDQFEGIDVTKEIPEPLVEEPAEPVVVKVEEPKDGGSGIVDCKKAFPPPKMIDDSLEEEEEKKLPEELQPEQLMKLEHIQESNA